MVEVLSVLRGERVTAAALLFAISQSTPTSVLPAGRQLHVQDVDADPVAAQVVDCQAIGNRTAGPFPSYTVYVFTVGGLPVSTFS